MKAAIVLCVLCLCSQLCSASFPRFFDERRVLPGKNVVLRCVSNDNSHGFMYWHFTEDNIVIGPSNHFDRRKYEYEVLTGNLTITAITTEEDGLYHCISEGVDSRDILISSIRIHVVVRVNESNSTTFVIICSILAVIFVVLCGIYGGFLLYYKKRDENIAYVNTNDEEDDSIDELFTREPSTSQHKFRKETNGDMDDFTKVHSIISVDDNT